MRDMGNEKGPRAGGDSERDSTNEISSSQNSPAGHSGIPAMTSR
jgi:hypothetical protein